jgi:hypothetical protein
MTTYIMLTFVIMFFITLFVYKLQYKSYYTYLQNLSAMVFIITFIIGIFQYIDAVKKEQIEKKNTYIDKILNEFIVIDNYLISNYQELSILFKYVYNKTKIPSSGVNLKKEYEQSSIKTKDMIFILFNKLTYLLEKMFVLDPTLFNNDKLGKKVRSFIENDLYKKYWLNNYILFDETFFMFINNHYRFLKFQQEEFGAVMGEIHQF